MGVNMVFKSFFFKQLNNAMAKKKIARIHPLHYVINMIALCVFPFIAAPLLKHIGGMDEKSFGALLDERQELVPRWIHSIMLTR